MVGVLVQGVSSAGSREHGLERLNELGCNALLNVDPRVGHAYLPAVDLNAELCLGDRLLEVGVLEDQRWGLPAQLKDNLLQVGTRSLLLNHLASTA